MICTANPQRKLCAWHGTLSGPGSATPEGEQLDNQQEYEFKNGCYLRQANSTLVNAASGFTSTCMPFDSFLPGDRIIAEVFLKYAGFRLAITKERRTVAQLSCTQQIPCLKLRQGINVSLWTAGFESATLFRDGSLNQHMLLSADAYRLSPG